MIDSKLSNEGLRDLSRNSRASSVISTNVTQTKTEQLLKNINTSQFNIRDGVSKLEIPQERSDKIGDYSSPTEKKPDQFFIQPPLPTRSSAKRQLSSASSSSFDVNSDTNHLIYTKPISFNFTQSPSITKENKDPLDTYVQKTYRRPPCHKTINDSNRLHETSMNNMQKQGSLIESVKYTEKKNQPNSKDINDASLLYESYHYRNNQPHRKSVNFSDHSENKNKETEFSIADSLSIFRCMDSKLDKTPNFISTSLIEKQFQSPCHNLVQQMEESYTEQQEDSARTLFSFLHCFPPSTLLKIIPTQCAVKNLTEFDSGKLALVPTEVLLDLQDNRRSLQELVESQRHIIQLMQQGAQKNQVEKAFETSQILENKSKQNERHFQNPKQGIHQNCMIQ